MTNMFGKIFQKNRRRNSEPAAVPNIPSQFPSPIDHHSRIQRMIDATPLNVYGNSMDHGYETGTSNDTSRRSSCGIREAALPSRRRYTMQNRLQISRPVDNVRKTSYQVSPSAARQVNAADDDDDLRPMPLNKRRMSVPENVFRRCDFAIMRPIRMFTNESSYEIVSAFDRHADPYHTFMKSFTCYEVQPAHSSLVIFDGRTKVKTAVNALSQQGHLAAIVSDTSIHSSECVFNMSDCLNAILMVVSGDKDVATKSLSTFLKDTGSSVMICSGIEKSVWEASQVLTLNKLNCIPIFDTVSPRPATPLFFLTARLILQEVVLKLTDVGEAVLFNVRQATVEQKKIGVWSDVTKIGQDQTIEDAIKIFVEKKYSTLPVVDVADKLVGVISRRDVITEIMGHQMGSYLNVLREPIKGLPTMRNRPAFGTANLTIYEALIKLVNTDKQCIPIVDDKMNVLAIISYGDFLSYIQTSPASQAV